MNNDGIQIRVSDLLHALFKHKVLIVLLTVAGLAVGILTSGISYLRGDMSKNYIITASVAVNSKVSTGNYANNNSFPTNNDYHLAEDMVDAVIYILCSQRNLSAAVDSLDLQNVSRADIKANLSMEQYSDTLIIQETLYWDNAEDGTAILNAINSVGTEVLQETMNIGGISVINSPTSQYVLGGSLNAMLCVILAMLGFAAGVGISILELLLRPTVLNPNDLAMTFDLDILGEVPDKPEYFRQSTSLLTRNADYPDLVNSFTAVAHAVRSRISADVAHPCLCVASTTKNEGKTLVAANLALQLADADNKVLLVDLNLQNPGIGRLFLTDVRYEHSLNALYHGDINEVEAVVPLTGRLDLLPAVLEEKSLALDSNLFRLVQKLAENYDYVILDTAPIGLSASALNVCAIATAVLFVVRYDTASVKEIRDTLDKIDQSGVPILGCVVNAMKGQQLTQSQKTNRYSERLNHPVRRARPDSILADVRVEEGGPAVNTGLSTPLTPEDTDKDYAGMLYRMGGAVPDDLPDEPLPKAAAASVPETVVESSAEQVSPTPAPASAEEEPSETAPQPENAAAAEPVKRSVGQWPRRTQTTSAKHFKLRRGKNT